MEENPFVFGKAVEGSYFTNRTKDAAHLEANLSMISIKCSHLP